MLSLSLWNPYSPRMADMPKSKRDVNIWFGKRLYQLRVESGRKPAEMGQLCNVSADHWYKFERGERGINLAQLMMLAQNLNMTIDRLVYGAGPRPKILRKTEIRFD